MKILFSVLRQRSNHIAKVEDPSSSVSVPLQFDVNYFRRIVEALICPKATGDEAENLLDVVVRDLFLDTWLNVYADIRWFFLRETGVLLDKADMLSEYPFMPENALFILEKVNSMPTDTSEKQQFWIEGLGSKPKPRKKSNGEVNLSSDEDDETLEKKEADDWRAFFDDPKPSDADGKPKGKSRRIHTMTIHEQLHSVSAHRAVFTKCWLTLLPLLSRGRATVEEEGDDEQDNLTLVTRALNVLHRGVMPYLTRAVLVMDWVAGCVDYGTSWCSYSFYLYSHIGEYECVGGNVGLLALNALFILMQEYNLYVCRGQVLLLCTHNSFKAITRSFTLVYTPSSIGMFYTSNIVPAFFALLNSSLPPRAFSSFCEAIVLSVLTRYVLAICQSRSSLPSSSACLASH